MFCFIAVVTFAFGLSCACALGRFSHTCFTISAFSDMNSSPILAYVLRNPLLSSCILHLFPHMIFIIYSHPVFFLFSILTLCMPTQFYMCTKRFWSSGWRNMPANAPRIIIVSTTHTHLNPEMIITKSCSIIKSARHCPSLFKYDDRLLYVILFSFHQILYSSLTGSYSKLQASK